MEVNTIMSKVKVGVIGLGEIAQVAHLPILDSLSDKFEISAICDISEQLLKHIGEKYKVENLYTDAIKLTEQEDLDAVFILNSTEYHVECAISAVKNKKHVLVEKPLCHTFAEAQSLIEARDKSGVQVMVGYMRRFAPAFIQAIEEVKNLEQIKYVRVRDIIGPNDYFTRQATVAKRFSDVPQSAVEDRYTKAHFMIKEAIGDDAPDELSPVYNFMGSLSCHDFSAMRELIGMPKKVLGASRLANGGFMNVLFEYEGFNVNFETGTDAQGRFDAHIEVYAQNKSIKIEYDTPYIRNLPITLTVTETVGDSYSQNVIRPTYTDPYTTEINYFYDMVTKGLTPKTTPEDAMEDLAISKMIIDALK